MGNALDATLLAGKHEIPPMIHKSVLSVAIMWNVKSIESIRHVNSTAVSVAISKLVVVLYYTFSAALFEFGEVPSSVMFLLLTNRQCGQSLLSLNLMALEESYQVMIILL